MLESMPLPHDYVPFKKLDVCGNTMINGQVPISVDGVPAFLVGKGPEPLIWLNALTSTGWQPLVRASKSLHKQVTVLSLEPRTWQVSVVGDVVFEVFVPTEEDEAEITKLNLRPLGMDIYGNQLGLDVRNTHMFGNKFTNVETMIAVGRKSDSASP